MTYRFFRGMRPGRLSLLLTCSLLATTLAACIHEPRLAPPEQVAPTLPRSGPFAEISARIQQEMTESDVPSFAVAVAQNGKIVWEAAFGWADREKRIPATVHTMYSIASVSKPFTATGMMVLVQKGELDLDAPVNRYLFRENQMHMWTGKPEQVTLRQLANHTAGLPRHEHFFYGSEAIGAKPDMEESIRRYGNIVRPPGERYRYSNFGYGILDHVIERTSGLDFATFMRREVFLPLGMTRSSVGIGPGLDQFAATRYADSGDPLPYYVTDHPGASEIYTSMHDLVRFGMFHLGHLDKGQRAILSNESRLAMQVPTSSQAAGGLSPTDEPPRMGYGIGWNISRGRRGVAINHAGGMGGVAAMLYMMPEEDIVVAAAANGSSRLPWTIPREIVSALLPEDEERSAEGRRRRRGRGGRSGEQGFEPVPELLGDWEGMIRTYDGDFPMTLSFKESGDIHAQVGDQYPVVVTDARIADGRLTGRMGGRIRTSDSNRGRWHPGHHLDIDLNLRGETLNGAIIAVAGNALSYWVELHRKASEAAVEQNDTAPSSPPNEEP